MGLQPVLSVPCPACATVHDGQSPSLFTSRFEEAELADGNWNMAYYTIDADDSEDNLEEAVVVYD